jgi:hypothetical protein
MRGWRWLGVVLCLLWLAGFGGWLWSSSVGGRDEWYTLQLQRCYSSSNMKRERLQADNGQYGQRIADISHEYYYCTERAKAIFDTEMDQLRSRVWKIMAVNAGVLATIWVLVFVGVPVGRRVAAALRQRA